MKKLLILLLFCSPAIAKTVEGTYFKLETHDEKTYHLMSVKSIEVNTQDFCSKEKLSTKLIQVSSDTIKFKDGEHVKINAKDCYCSHTAHHVRPVVCLF